MLMLMQGDCHGLCGHMSTSLGHVTDALLTILFKEAL